MRLLKNKMQKKKNLRRHAPTDRTPDRTHDPPPTLRAQQQTAPGLKTAATLHHRTLGSAAEDAPRVVGRGEAHRARNLHRRRALRRHRQLLHRKRAPGARRLRRVVVLVRAQAVLPLLRDLAEG